MTAPRSAISLLMADQLQVPEENLWKDFIVVPYTSSSTGVRLVGEIADLGATMHTKNGAL